jgi:Holliday junction resolvase
MPKKRIPCFTKTSEASLQRNILRFLRAIPKSWWVKFPAGKWSIAGVPDILGCYHGRFIAFEVKTATGRPTKLQLQVIGAIRAAGGTALIVRSVKGVQYAIDDLRSREGIQ